MLIRAGSGSLACAASDSRALSATPGRDQPPLHQEPLSDADEKYLVCFVSASADSGHRARFADFRILRALQPGIALGARPILVETRIDPRQTKMDPGASQSQRPRTGSLV